MKKTVTILFSLLTAFLLHATVRTVSNNPSTLAQYNTIQAAINASASGDTIYVHGSPLDYAGFTMTDIRLTIIGPGWSPDKNFPFTARVGAVTITGALSSNSEFHGLTFIAAFNAYTGTHPDGLKFYRNEIQNYIYLHGSTPNLYKDYVFQGNYFNTAYIYATGGTTYQSFLFQNNVFYNNGGWSFNALTLTIGVLIDHNLFYGPSSGSTDVFTGTCNGLTISNNVFVRRNAANSCNSSVFNNNITYLTSNDNPWAANGNTNAGGNVAGQNPQMADQTAVNAGTNNSLLDFTIAAGPANNSSSDTPTPKDMGLLYDPTGSLNWTNSRNSRLPRMYSMSITNPTIPVGGTLNVQVEGRKSN